MKNDFIDLSNLPSETSEILKECPEYFFIKDYEELFKHCFQNDESYYEVLYDIPEIGKITEATVCKVKNGIAVNYNDTYMRRRDPDCLLIGDDLPSDKPKFKKIYNKDFKDLRKETFEWLKKQDLILLPFIAGNQDNNLQSLAIIPKNAAFFAYALALLQGYIDFKNNDNISNFSPKAIIYVAPPFRHIYFKGKQIVVHNRLENIHEMFSYNLYPGPSAKKGVYGVLLNIGEQEKWITAHCSAIKMITPYDNKITIMHEGASGGGKSELLEHIHRESDGTICLGINQVTNEKRVITLPKECIIQPVCDDMAICHPSIQKTNEKLTLTDAENSWFIRVNHIDQYGTDPFLEKLTIHAKEKLLFFNINAAPDSTALIWDHIEDKPGKRCPNPRVIIPRNIIPDIINEPVSIDIRSFGVRTPLTTNKHKSYGIIGIFHVLPPSIAWLWRLVSPRGYANPSIIDSEDLSSEGVGSYWPFATGKKIDHANLLLEQIQKTSNTQYVLCPNQYIGAWKVDFMPQWIMREYLARRGGFHFTLDQISPARCPLLGYSLNKLVIEGQNITEWFRKVETQPEVGTKVYDHGAKLLTDFFKKELKSFLSPELNSLGKQIIECCLSDGSIDDYKNFIKGLPIINN